MEKRSSSRLAAKPTIGWTAMEKVQMVLLKKSGILLEDSIPQAADLKRYRKLYSKLLPENFIQAMTALVEKGIGGKLKLAELGLMAA
jgi:hypothetical protein